jgi:uncharacterized protein YndB with AHSA1/START domain
LSERLTHENFTVLAVHHAPRELVFAVLTTPEHLTHFWGPTGTHTPIETIVVDLRPGGAFETTMISNHSGDRYTMRAVYVDVDPPRYLSWREVDSEVLTKITFTDLGDGSTEVVTAQLGLPPAMRTPDARAGWETALGRNASYIASLMAEEPGA